MLDRDFKDIHVSVSFMSCFVLDCTAMFGARSVKGIVKWDVWKVYLLQPEAQAWVLDEPHRAVKMLLRPALGSSMLSVFI